MSLQAQKDTAQNRLLVATAVLSFIYYAGAKISAISVAGASVSFSNEGAVLEFAWFIWTYYYLRCYQYYKKLGVQNFRESLNNSYLASFGHRLVRLSRDEFQLLPDDDGVKSSSIRLGWGRNTGSRTPRSKSLSNEQRLRYLRKMYKTRSVLHLNLVRPRRRLRRFLRKMVYFPFDLVSVLLGMSSRFGSFRAVVYPPGNRESLKGQNKYTVPLPFWMPVLVFWVYARTALARPEFIENQGPLVLGLIPVWYLIVRDWAQIYRLVG